MFETARTGNCRDRFVTIPVKEARVASFRKLSDEFGQKTSKRRTQRMPAYEKWRRDDLYHLAQQNGIEDRENMTNEELVHAISQVQSGAR